MDEVCRAVDVEAPLARVWTCITEGVHIRAWTGVRCARVDLRPAGLVEHHWDHDAAFFGVIDELTPTRRFGYRYSVVEARHPEPGTSTHVRFELAALPDARTRVHVTERGIASLAFSGDEREQYHAVSAEGWETGLDMLAAYARMRRAAD